MIRGKQAIKKTGSSWPCLFICGFLLCSCFSNFINFVDGCNNILLGYRERKILGRLGSDTGSRSDGFDFVINYFIDSQICKLGGKSNGLTEIKYLIKLFCRGFFQDELTEGSVSNLFTVKSTVSLRNLSKTVIDCVSSSKSAAFETDTA